MDTFFQAVAIVLLSVILSLVLKKTNSGIGELLSILVCGMVILVSLHFITPVMDFIRRLEQVTHLDTGMVKIILKVVGVSITAEIAELICNDSGNNALGKTLQILASFMIIVLSVPLLSSLLDFIEEVINRL